ncbi:MAG: DEAD/DEAH box helicase, partial [Bdellovibrionota bacterium]
MRFESLDLIEPLLKALHAEGYTEPTPIQRQAIPHVLQERDLLGCAQTGTGKTAAFALPILQLLAKDVQPGAKRKIRTLVLTPTRELAAQIDESFQRYGANLGLSTTVVFGGVGQGSQVSALRKGVDILVATPGRLLDLIDQGYVSLSDLKFFVLDEADRMLDMGFIHDVKKLLKIIPKKRQSLFFSATMPPDIQRLANDILSNPVKVEVTPVATTAEKIDQSVYMVDSKEGKRFLLQHLLKGEDVKMALVFTRTKHGADKVTRFLNSVGVTAEAIHGNKSQNNRVRAL